MKDERIKIELNSHWDIENSTLLTRKIYEIVEQHHIKATIKARASELELTITILLGSYPILRDIINWIRKWREQRQLSKVRVRHWKRVTVEQTADSRKIIVEETVEEV